MSTGIATARPPGPTAAGPGGPARQRTSSPAHYLPLLAALPALCFLAVFLLAPMASFLAKGFVTGPGGSFTLENYAAVFTDPAFRQSMLNSVYVASGSTVIALAIAVPTALHLTQMRGAARRVADAVLAFPLSLPGVVVGFFTIMLFGRAGLVTQAEAAVTGTDFLQISYQLPGLVFAYTYFQLPRVLSTIQGAAELADPTTEEVAASLGASNWQVFKDVLLPPLYPAIFSAASIAVASSLGAYGTVAALSEGFRVLPLDIADQATVLNNVNLAAAMAVVLTAISLLFSIAGKRLVKKVTA